MRNEELRKQIEALRSEVRALGDSFQSLRQDDVRTALVRQIRPVLMDMVDRDLDEDVFLAMPRSELAVLRRDISRWLEGALDAFGRENSRGGMEYLQKHPAGRVVEDLGIDQAEELMRSLEAQLVSYFNTYTNALQVGSSGVTGPGPGSAVLSPSAAEAALGPLSSSIRISILQRLSDEDDGLAALSRYLNMKKGHLQFHLKVLVDAGYISYDRKSRLYSISGRGRVALDSISNMLEALAGA